MLTQSGGSAVREPLVVDLARSRRVDRVIALVVGIVLQVLLIVGATEAWKAHSVYQGEIEWFEQQRRLGRTVAISSNILGDPIMFRMLSQFLLVFEFLALLTILGTMRRMKQRLTISGGRVRIETTFGSRELELSTVHRLSFFQPANLRGHAGVYSIEARDGTIARFHVARPDAESLPVGTAIDRLALETGTAWVGRGGAPTGFRAFLGELRAAAAVRSHIQFVGWILRNAFFIRAESAGGVNLALFRWSIPFFVIPFLAFLLVLEVWLLLSPAMILGNEMIGRDVDAMKDQREFMKDYVVMPHPFVAFIALGWISTCLGVNAMMNVLRLQERKRELVEGDLRAARELQARLVPQRSPVLEGYDIAGAYVAAREVAGDYFDYVALGPGSLCIALGDVSGKGLPAGFVMTMVKGSVLTQLQTSTDLPALMSALNRTIRQTAENIFVTMAVVHIDTSANRVTLVRAGHNPPLLVRNSGAVEWLSPRGVGLGLTSARSFDRLQDSEELVLTAGDTLLLYSDGLTEAMNGIGDEYGNERFAEHVVSLRGHDATELRNAILEDVVRFRSGAEISDDLTLVVIRATA